jgi:hypothetical protein
VDGAERAGEDVPEPIPQPMTSTALASGLLLGAVAVTGARLRKSA